MKRIKSWNNKADKTICGNCGASDWNHWVENEFSKYECRKCSRYYYISLYDGTIFDGVKDEKRR